MHGQHDSDTTKTVSQQRVRSFSPLFSLSFFVEVFSIPCGLFVGCEFEFRNLVI